MYGVELWTMQAESHHQVFASGRLVWVSFSLPGLLSFMRHWGHPLVRDPIVRELGEIEIVWTRKGFFDNGQSGLVAKGTAGKRRRLVSVRCPRREKKKWNSKGACVDKSSPWGMGHRAYRHWAPGADRR